MAGSVEAGLGTVGRIKVESGEVIYCTTLPISVSKGTPVTLTLTDIFKTITTTIK